MGRPHVPYSEYKLSKDAVHGRTSTDANGCWIWRGPKDKGGYGRFRAEMAHRYSYRTFIGPIPTGLTLDHLCRNPGCVNPAHLEPTTMWENTLRGNSISALHARQTHCKHGHEFNEKNTYRMPRDGRRMCRICTNRRVAAYLARKRAVGEA